MSAYGAFVLIIVILLTFIILQFSYDSKTRDLESKERQRLLDQYLEVSEDNRRLREKLKRTEEADRISKEEAQEFIESLKRKYK